MELTKNIDISIIGQSQLDEPCHEVILNESHSDVNNEDEIKSPQKARDVEI
jgi:hypothetical protein